MSDTRDDDEKTVRDTSGASDDGTELEGTTFVAMRQTADVKQNMAQHAHIQGVSLGEFVTYEHLLWLELTQGVRKEGWSDERIVQWARGVAASSRNGDIARWALDHASPARARGIHPPTAEEIRALLDNGNGTNGQPG